MTPNLKVDIGSDQDIYLGQSVTLTPLSSSEEAVMRWNLVEKPSNSKISIRNQQPLVFTPDVVGDYELEVKATLNTAKASDSVLISVTDNQLPLVEAGSDSSIFLGKSITLEGQASDPEKAALSILWSIKTKPSTSKLILSDTTKPSLRFQPDVAGDYELTLEASDELHKVQDTLHIFVKTPDIPNRLPVVEAGNDQIIQLGSEVTLSGSASDPDGDTLVINWSWITRPANSATNLSAASTLSPKFVPDQVGSYQLELSVSDGSDTQVDTVTIQATAIEENAAPSISSIQAQSVLRDGTLEVPFTVSDEDLSTLDLNTTSDNPSLIPNTRITLLGTGSSRKINLRPVAAQTGQSTITLTATDQEGKSSQVSFVVDVLLPFQTTPVSLFSDSRTSNDFGESVVLDDEVALVGSPRADQKMSDAGAVYIYQYNATTWQQKQIITATDGLSGDQFGASVALEGTTAIVGAPLADGNALDTGAAYIYTFNGSSWQQTQKLLPEDGVTNDQFGYSVSLSGNFLAIGSYQNGQHGAVYLFAKSANNWSFLKKLIPVSSSTNDRFGRSVVINKNDLMIGATSDNTLGAASGAVYVYGWTGSDWLFAQKLTASQGKTEDRFGRYISLEGDFAVIGAVYDNSFGEKAGSAYVFKRQAGNWIEQQRLLPDNAQAGLRFGHSVGISNGYIAIGAPGSPSLAGTIYLYEYKEGQWKQLNKLTAPNNQPNDSFALNMSFYKNTIIAGSINYKTSTSLGAAFLFNK